MNIDLVVGRNFKADVAQSLIYRGIKGSAAVLGSTNGIIAEEPRHHGSCE